MLRPITVAVLFVLAVTSGANPALAKMNGKVDQSTVEAAQKIREVVLTHGLEYNHQLISSEYSWLDHFKRLTFNRLNSETCSKLEAEVGIRPAPNTYVLRFNVDCWTRFVIGGKIFLHRTPLHGTIGNHGELIVHEWADPYQIVKMPGVRNPIEPDYNAFVTVLSGIIQKAGNNPCSTVQTIHFGNGRLCPNPRVQ